MQVKSKGKIITITSTKGGVGKTITTLNLAGVYSLMGKKVLILDLDLYGGNIATFVNSSNEKTISNLIEDYANNRYETIDDYIYKYNDFISIIAAPKDPRAATKIESRYIPILLDSVLYKYDVILIDTYHNLDQLNVVILDNSDSILYMFTNNSFDLKNTRTFMSIIKDTGMDNVYTLLNDSISLTKPYYSLYDIRSISKNNIDFNIGKNFYIKNIDKYIVEGKILTLNPNLNLLSGKEGKLFKEIAMHLISDNKEVKQ